MDGFALWEKEKKLRAAGAYWAGERVIDESLDDLKAFGASAADLEKFEKKEDAFEVWEENWPAVEMFLLLQTQWVVGVNGPVGLNYQSIEFLFKLYRSKKRRELFEDIREIERGALDAKSREIEAGASGT